MKNLGILLSGRGSNFVAIADGIAAGRIPDAHIAVVISNRADAYGLESARQRGISALVIPSKGKLREEHDREVVAALLGNRLDHGPIIVQRAVSVLDSDDKHTLAARILEQEHIAYSEAIKIVLDGKFEIVGRRLLLM